MQKLETVAAVLASLPVKVSERRFMSAAYRTGRHTLTGRQMLIRLAHI